MTTSGKPAGVGLGETLDPLGEIATLREQVEVLARTKRELSSTRDRVNRQLRHIQALSAFSLSCSGQSTVREILGQAIVLLSSIYDVDRMVAVVQDGEDLHVEALPEIDTENEATQALLAGLMASPGGVRVTRDPGGRMLSLLEKIEPTFQDGTVGFIPFRIAGETTDGYILLARREGGTLSVRREIVSDAQVPFLQLLGSHLEKALGSVRLTREADLRNAQLLKLNRQNERNMEDLKRLQKHLVQAGRLEAVGQLVGGVAHDFNNLLTAILTCGHVLGENLRETSHMEDVNQIVEAADRGARLVSQLLAFARRQHREPAHVDLNRVIRDTSKMLRRLVREDVSIQLDLHEGACPVWADLGQLEQAIVNLVLNARDAMPEGGRISIRTGIRAVNRSESRELNLRPGEYYTLAVEDDGSGMDEFTRLRVFEPFFSTKDVGQGTGMGLATVYGIVLQSEGSIAVTSEPGRGTKFEIYLPVRQGELPPAGEEAPARAAPQTGRRTLLLVEDESGMRRIAARLLRKRGYSVYAASGGSEALEILDEVGDRVDLLVTDVVMPEMSGPQLAGRVRDRRPDLGVLYMTGYSNEQFPEEEAGRPVRCLRKPFTPDELCAGVHEALDMEAQ